MKSSLGLSKWTDYIDLLIRIRKEHPEMYELSFGYYDYQVLTYLISSKQREKVPIFFSFFKKYHFFYHDLAWSYCGFLHDQKSMEWVRARFLAYLIKGHINRSGLSSAELMGEPAEQFAGRPTFERLPRPL